MELATYKKKSEILLNENITEIGGVTCTKIFKYLGVEVAIEKKEQTYGKREQIKKNIIIMRLRLGGKILMSLNNLFDACPGLC
jgi:hypothetical protein